MLKDSTSGFGLFTIALHWLCAVLIIFLFGLGIYMTGLDYYSPWYHKGPALHISLGLTLLALMVARVCWRLGNKKPAHLATYSRTTIWLAALVQYALYGLIFIVLLSGYFITTAEGKPASWFDLLHIPALTELNAENTDLAGEVHELLAWAIVILSGFHTLAALVHHFFYRDRTLIRMLKPVKKSSGEVDNSSS